MLNYLTFYLSMPNDYFVGRNVKHYTKTNIGFIIKFSSVN
jgi:hypothetical protein